MSPGQTGFVPGTKWVFFLFYTAEAQFVPALRTHTPQIRGVKISPPKFRERAPENTVKQVFFDDAPPKFGG